MQTSANKNANKYKTYKTNSNSDKSFNKQRLKLTAV